MSPAHRTTPEVRNESALAKAAAALSRLSVPEQLSECGIDRGEFSYAIGRADQVGATDGMVCYCCNGEATPAGLPRLRTLVGGAKALLPENLRLSRVDKLATGQAYTFNPDKTPNDVVCGPCAEADQEIPARIVVPRPTFSRFDFMDRVEARTNPGAEGLLAQAEGADSRLVLPIVEVDLSTVRHTPAFVFDHDPVELKARLEGIRRYRGARIKKVRGPKKYKGIRFAAGVDWREVAALEAEIMAQDFSSTILERRRYEFKAATIRAEAGFKSPAKG